MNNNALGHFFSVSSFGESHGPAVGCVITGTPAGIKLDIAAIQADVNVRKTANQSYTSQRKEDDDVEIISGIFEGVTLGSPICIIIKNKDAKSYDYDHLKETYRPNHADFTQSTKYGIRDYRGGGRSSIRATAPLVAAGAIAMQIMNQFSKSTIISFVDSIGDIQTVLPKKYNALKQENIYAQKYRLLENNAAVEKLVNQCLVEGDTLGGTIITLINNLEPGIGEPIFYKLQAALAQAMLSINTVKGFEYGDGFMASQSKGSAHNDLFTVKNNTIETLTNHSGGIQGGISNGMPIIFKTAFKPISSIKKTQQTINEKGDIIALEIGGRHDVCAVPRAVPIVRAYTAIILADLILQNQLSKI
jgi:chorismate synthase